ncbi:MAG TPA: class I tRNA ligase family protein, partial [Patescibacteria group bacterium]|nr:class I tRNA ligase family protein [Patescibacteria group bacterium]
SAAWSVEGMGGAFRFLQRTWTLVQEHLASKSKDQSQTKELQRIVHSTTKKVTEDLHELGFNTAIASLMECVNEMYKLKTAMPLGNEHWQNALETLIKLVAPFAPHVSEELWSQLGCKGSVHTSIWPVWDENLLVNEMMTIVVQVNGKLRANIEVPRNTSEADITEVAKANQKVAIYIKEREIKKAIYVTDKLINFVVG